MRSVKCPGCGFVGWADENCKRCGASRDPNAPADTQQPQTTYVQYQAGEAAHSQEKLNNGFAVTSLVLGIVGLFTFGLFGLGAIAGITLAIMALMNIKRNPREYGGKGVAIAGLVLSLISLMIVPFAIVLAIAIPNLVAARRAANEGSSIASLRTIHAAQATFQATRGAGAFGTLDDLAADGLINPELRTGVRNGYRFTVDLKTDDLNGEPGFQAVAVPVTYGTTGMRSFYVDQSGVIRSANSRGAAATEFDEPLDTGSRSPKPSPPSRATLAD